MGRVEQSKKKMNTILYIVENQNNFFTIQNLIAEGAAQEKEEEFFSLELVESVSNAMERLNRGNVDLVLTDLNVSDSKGLELVTNLRNYYPMIPIIVLADDSNPFTGLEAVRAGAQDYLLKTDLKPPGLRHSILHTIERFRIERMKDQFFTTASHQLLSSVAVMKGGLNILNMEVELLSIKQKEVFEVFKESIKRLLDIINNILNHCRLETAHFVVNCRNIQIKILIDEVIDNFKPQFKEKNVTIEEDISDLNHAFVDPHLILKVLSYLLINALHYVKKKITIKGLHYDGMICIQIIDDGLGIFSDDPNIFNEYEQLSRAQIPQGYHGMGLGLAICKEIIELHKGKIWVESDPEKPGARFCFTLPIANA